MPSQPPREIHIDEILRAGQKAEPGMSDTTFEPSVNGMPLESDVAKFLARWLDNILRIPGTDFKIGLDPILALFPGFGSTIASGGGLIILIEAVRSRVSVPVLMHMAFNLFINTLFDYIPALGPVASAFFKSNSRNLRLLQDWQAGHHENVKRSTWRLFLVLGCIIAVLIGMLAGLFALYVWLLANLFHGPSIP
ncbi:MAG: hypothetical protein RL015_1612 [Verrucomicrobiota bacterium]|jgi:nitrate reductase NapE component